MKQHIRQTLLEDYLRNNAKNGKIKKRDFINFIKI
jgi:hypothetical protein